MPEIPPSLRSVLLRRAPRVSGLPTDIHRRGRREGDPQRKKNKDRANREEQSCPKYTFIVMFSRVVGAPTPTNIISNRNRPSTPTIHLKSNLLTLEYLLGARVDAIILARPGDDGLVMIRIGALRVGGDLSVKLPYIINSRQNADGAKQAHVLMKSQPHRPLSYLYRA